MPYYGATGMGQVELSANTIGGEPQIKSMRILSKSASDTKATVTFSLNEGAAAPSASGPCNNLPVVIYDNYAVQNRETKADGVYETSAGGFTGAPVTVSWLGVKEGSCTYDAATKTYTQDIDIAINTDTENTRTGAVIVFSPSGREVTRFVVEQDKLPQPSNPDKPIINGIEIQKLVPSGANSANCYIITAPGRYELPAYEGAHSNAELAEAHRFKGTPDIVWNDTPANKVEFFQGHLADDKIIIDINPTLTNGEVTGHGSSIENGNALVAIKDEVGNILWSWHLWFCKDDPRGILSESGKIMLRNLGAKKLIDVDMSLTNEDLDLYKKDGLYYQWGRKDPLNINIISGNDKYIKAEGNSGSNADLHPNTFYKSWNGSEYTWSDAKSISDPCPPGYKVPSIDVWNKSKNDFNRLSATNYGFIYDMTSLIVFPYAGYLDSLGDHQPGEVGSGGVMNKEYTYTIDLGIYKETINTIEYKPGRVESKSAEDKPSYLPKRFSSIKYNILDSSISGYLWTNGKNALQYGYKDEGFDIIQCYEQVGDWKREQQWSLSGRKYYWVAVMPDENASKTPIQNPNNALTSAEKDEIIGAIENQLRSEAWSEGNWEYLAELLTKSFIKDPIYEKPTDSSKSNGYQVRCVKE